MAPCDRCGRKAEVSIWYLHPAGQPRKIRLLCPRCAKPVQEAYDAVARKPTGAEALRSKLQD